MGEIIKLIAMRPVTFFILLTMAVLLMPSAVIPYWYKMMKRIEQNVEIETSNDRKEIVSKLEDVSKLIIPFNSSANNLATFLAPILKDKPLSFSDIQTQVSRALFEAQLMLPIASQVSYIGMDGLMFSYVIDNGGKKYAVYSNSSFPSNLTDYTWYAQLVEPNTGKLRGEANIIKSYIVTNEVWFQRAMSGYASIGSRWTHRVNREGEELDLFLDTSRVGDESGAVSIGYSIKEIIRLISGINLRGGNLYMVTLGDYEKILLDGIKDVKVKINGDNNKALVQVDNANGAIVGEVPCKLNKDGTNGDEGTSTILDVGGASLIFSCSHIDIARIPLAYVLAFPSQGLVDMHHHTKVALILLILMMVAMVISVVAFVVLVVRGVRREVQLCAAYMRQMEKTSQAERKSMKQSLAFATANHDVRGYLACIKSLIDNSYNDVLPSSQLAFNFTKMNTCVQDLLDLVNSILDFSKIEAGKMQLEEREFELTKLIEDITDMHHLVAIKKGVEVILDPCDGSLMKFSHVKGDAAKLKQILGNLLSNAVKFTSQGHISIRAWARKPSLENSIIASNKNSLLNRVLSRLLSYKNNRAYCDLEGMTTIKQDPNCMEFEFEVEDTGLGIPKDKREYIFENFVQVNENSAGHVGTGLGLGIVQSYIRLMGGDIEVVDKANTTEQGACFKFNIFLIVQQDTSSPIKTPRQKDMLIEHQETTSCTSCAHSPRHGGSIVVILIKHDERRQMIQRYMESLQLKLVIVKQSNQLLRALRKMIKPKVNVTQFNNNDSSSERSSLPLSAMDGLDDILPVYINAKTARCILLIIDANAGDFHELRRSVAQFRKDQCQPYCIKVVWLERPDTCGVHFPGLQDGALPLTDCIMVDPLHGSRLTSVLELLPEFGGDLQRVPGYGMSTSGSEIQEIDREDIFFSSVSKPLRGKKVLIVVNDEIIKGVTKGYLKTFGALVDVCQNVAEAVELIHRALQERIPRDSASNLPYDYILLEIEMEGINGSEAVKLIRNEEGKYGIHIPILGFNYDPSSGRGKRIVEAGLDSYLDIPVTGDALLQALRNAEKETFPSDGTQDTEIKEVTKKNEGQSSINSLEGKRFLIAEDLDMLRHVAATFLTHAGAYVEGCENGKEAFELICKALNDMTPGEPSGFPYDCVLMDCQMPIMNGFEATKRIREEEKKYGVHIPIIALTADKGDEEVKKIVESGMDLHLTKPLQTEELAKAMKIFHDKLKFVEKN